MAGATFFPPSSDVSCSVSYWVLCDHISQPGIVSPPVSTVRCSCACCLWWCCSLRYSTRRPRSVRGRIASPTTVPGGASSCRKLPSADQGIQRQGVCVVMLCCRCWFGSFVVGMVMLTVMAGPTCCRRHGCILCRDWSHIMLHRSYCGRSIRFFFFQCSAVQCSAVTHSGVRTVSHG